MTLTLPLHLIPLPTPFPVGPVNVYLAEGEPLTLIDTGPRDPATLAALEAGLREHGYRVEDLRRIVLTHLHVDHFGLCGDLVARSGAEVLTHAFNLPWLPDYAAERERHRAFYRRIWAEGGVPEEMIQAMEQGGAAFARWLSPVQNAQALNEGDILTLAGAEWRVYHTPGHAGGLICLWEAGSRTLLANDHLIRDISSNPILEPSPLHNGPRPKRLVEYIHHMQRMAALEPLVALPGHGEVVDDVPGLVRQRLAFHQRRARKILDSLTQPKTLWELTQPIFPQLKRPLDYVLGLSEILGHLDLLEEDGSARPVCKGDVIRWARV